MKKSCWVNTCHFTNSVYAIACKTIDDDLITMATNWSSPQVVCGAFCLKTFHNAFTLTEGLLPQYALVTLKQKLYMKECDDFHRKVILHDKTLFWCSFPVIFAFNHLTSYYIHKWICMRWLFIHISGQLTGRNKFDW